MLVLVQPMFKSASIVSNSTSCRSAVICASTPSCTITDNGRVHVQESPSMHYMTDDIVQLAACNRDIGGTRLAYARHLQLAMI